MSLLDLSRAELFLGIGVFLLASVGGLGVAGMFLVRIPAAYFTDSHPRDWWVEQHPILRWTGLVLKNVLGALVASTGVILAAPGIPGPGVLMILIGLSLVDFPGKRRLERRLIGRPRILPAVNRLRRRFGREPLVLDEPPLSKLRA